MIPGIPLTLGGDDFIIPPLNFAALKKLQPVIESLATISSSLEGNQIDAITQIVHSAMSRNYPDITLEKVMDILDLGNAPTILAAIMNSSGLKPAGE